MEELKIIQEKENPLFGRKEISAEIESKVVPSRSQVCELLSRKFSVPKENIKIKKIDARFGSRTFTIESNIYKSKEDRQRIETEKKKDKEPQEKPAEAVASEGSEKKPEPEAKEEVKQEEKKEEAETEGKEEKAEEKPESEVKEELKEEKVEEKSE